LSRFLLKSLTHWLLPDPAPANASPFGLWFIVSEIVNHSNLYRGYNTLFWSN
jgi:hypothetical protein